MRKIIYKILVIVLTISFIYIGTVEAKVTSTDPTTTSGGEVNITLKSSEPAYAYKITLEDAGGLTFSSATSTSGQVNGTIANGASTTGVTTLATYKFKTPTVTTNTTYSVKFNVSISVDGEVFENISNTSKVTVNAPAPVTPPTPKSSDATLKSITVGGKKYTGSALNGTISQTVESSVNTISISAEKNDSKAKISGTGTKTLTAGQTNSYSIKVTAEDGTAKTYKVNIIRKAIENTNPNIIENNPPEVKNEEKLKLTSLVIKDVELNTEFNSDILNYIANVKNMEQLEIDATTNKEGAEIKIEGASELKEGNNKILITAILGEENIQYTIELYNQIEKLEDNNLEINSNENKQDKTIVDEIMDVVIDRWLVISLIIIIFILAIIAIIFAILTYKYSKKIKELIGDASKKTDSIDEKNVEVQEKEENTEKIKKIGKHF